ncbi:MAG: hypothetical protein JRH19_15160, partial [Deltaproteobacteria bacterium]|nr:hypothetical protein [Deltaproteobacteria bacterium]
PKKTTKRFSEFYRELAARPPDSVTVIEAPYSGFGLYAPYPSYQLRHRQRVWVASEIGACEPENTNPFRHHPGMALHNVFYLAEPRAIDESGADYLVVHRNPALETSFYRANSWHGRNLRMAGDECVEFAKATWGAPVFEDEDLAVFVLPGLLPHE